MCKVQRLPSPHTLLFLVLDCTNCPHVRACFLLPSGKNYRLGRKIVFTGTENTHYVRESGASALLVVLVSMFWTVAILVAIRVCRHVACGTAYGPFGDVHSRVLSPRDWRVRMQRVVGRVGPGAFKCDCSVGKNNPSVGMYIVNIFVQQ